MRTSILAFATLALPAIGPAIAQQQNEPSNASSPQQAAQSNAVGAEKLLSVPVTKLQIGGAPKPPRIENPLGDSAEVIEQGRQLFNAMNCSGCHAPMGGGGMGPPLSDKTWIYGGSPADVHLSIVQGRPNGMPAWNHLGEEAIWMLTAYVRSLDRQAQQLAEDRAGQAGQSQAGREDERSGQSQ